MANFTHSKSSLDRLEDVIVEFTATQASTISKLDALLLKMNALVTNQPFLSSSSVKSPSTDTTMLMLLPTIASHHLKPKIISFTIDTIKLFSLTLLHFHLINLHF